MDDLIEQAHKKRRADYEERKATKRAGNLLLLLLLPIVVLLLLFGPIAVLLIVLASVPWMLITMMSFFAVTNKGGKEGKISGRSGPQSSNADRRSGTEKPRMSSYDHYMESKARRERRERNR